MASVSVDIMKLLQKSQKALQLPKSLQMDYLPEKGDALSYQPDQAPKVVKSWINGSKVYSLAFSVLAVTDGSSTSAPNIRAVGWLEAIGSLFEGMSNFALSDSRIVISGEMQTPAIIRRTEDGRLVYAISIEIRYKEI